MEGTPLNFCASDGIYLIQILGEKKLILRGVKDGDWYYVDPSSMELLERDYDMTDPDYPDISYYTFLYPLATGELDKKD